MSDHPLFPDMQEEPIEQIPAEPMNEPIDEPVAPVEELPVSVEPVVPVEELPVSVEPEIPATQPVLAEECNAPVSEDANTQEPQETAQDSEETEASASEPTAQAPFAAQQAYYQQPYYQQPYQQPYYQQPYQQPMYNPYAPYGMPQQPPTQQPAQPPKFDPYTGKPVRPREEKKPAKPKKKKSGGLGWRLAVFGLCLALIGGLVGGLIGFGLAPRNNTTVIADPHDQVSQSPTQSQTQTQKPSGTTTPPANLSALYEAAVPTIVGVLSEYTTYNYFGQASTSSATGTGFVISPDGEILTNYHVIEGAQELTITMYDGTEYTAEVLGYEAESDVALIKIDAADLPYVTMGDSDTLMVGEQITAIGNPLGELTHTMTVGYVSAKSRAVYTDEMPINMMQIDAAINPGNSGGPLFNLNGEVVGITTAKYSGTVDGSATIEGIGFAIPINDVLAIVDDLREFGSVQNRAYMGVTVTNNVAGGDLPAGALVQSIEKASPASAAGLRLGDIIVGVGQTKVYGVDTLYQALRPYRGGDTAELTVFRSGETIKLNITFTSTPATEEPTETQTEQIPTEEFPWGYFFP